MIQTILLLIGIVLATLIALKLKPQTSRKAYNKAETLRRVVGVAFVAIAAWVWLRSGVAALMLVSVLAVAFTTAYLYFEQPHKEVV